MRHFLILLLSLVGIVGFRIPGSPYPAVTKQPQKLFIVDSGILTDSENVLVQSLQGHTAKIVPLIYRIPSVAQLNSWLQYEALPTLRGTIENQSVASMDFSAQFPNQEISDDGALVWMLDLARNWNVALNFSFSSDAFGLLQYVHENVVTIPGYILADSPNRTCINIAYSISALYKDVLVISSAGDEQKMQKLGIKRLFHITEKEDYSWFYENFGHILRQNSTILIFQKPIRFACLADYTIFAGAVSYFSPTTTTTQNITAAFYDLLRPNSAVLGWGDSEFGLVSYSTEKGTFVNAADWATNLAVLTNFNVQNFTQKKVASLQQPEAPADKHSVCFLFTDGDNIQWILNGFANDTRWYSSPFRGETNIGWTLSPALAELAPTVLDYIYRNASAKVGKRDYFVAAPSGLGYMYPNYDAHEELQEFGDLTARMMAKADMTILNVIGTNHSAQYLDAFLEQDQISSVLFYDFDNYAGMQGNITFGAKQKPVIGARFRLWKGFETPASLAEKLNQMPIKPQSEVGYSLIAVHVWTMTVESVVETVKLLDLSRVDVVTPHEFVDRIRSNVTPT
eukprot:TRINITY_DN7355_c0_g1_i1.p1 TRINITY_DN7355_c0_g1~~TRINITY_DN7355_c0_g1_i1.p1  ORF type:complete len:568 (-),score=62.82 TRINITY_DN7355_c0_g1_i1:276-1979(-)